jgi:hypothetical protein
MNLRTDRMVDKAGRWEQVAREFEYRCRVCGARPKLEDSLSYLVGGICLDCNAKRSEVTHSHDEGMH